MRSKVDLLNGNILRGILLFFLPVFLGNLLQQLYNTVDAAIVGHFASATALSAVGGSSAQVVNLMVGFFTGLSAGCTVVIAQFVGARSQRLDDALHTTFTFGLTGGIVCGTLGYIIAPGLLRIMQTPEEIMRQSTLYVRVYFVGLVFVFIYNLGSAVLRAIGDSVRPLLFLAVCTVINIILDLLFVVVLHLDVLGVALATLIAQGVSAGMITETLMHRTPGMALNLRRLRINGPLLGNMLKIGLPSGIQTACFSVANMFIQSAINVFGVNTISGWTAQTKADSIFWMVNGSFGITVQTFVGQNYGAGNRERVKKGTLTCLALAVASALVISTFLYVCGKYMVWIFTTDPEVMAIGLHMIRLIVPGYVIYVFVEIFSGALKARGNALAPMLVNVFGIVIFRTAWVYFFRNMGNIDLVLYCFPISWAICATAIVGYYLYLQNKGRI